ncbi:(Fe-S)-binding protein [Tanticharoenia sakaeratensis]|uniref:Oxidoreductase, iron-sulphur binding subunit n=1 Tax=Tanticharoenia sakaeratensis NBRC 103193 TaxID=1231623 RepID=A0A0D6MKN3_9PROT|nr:(Fe-S)-binding protein [Tanticharoenia sakaeratensis]GAN54010.1 oxidoreductase, iron-sulphur binding subunit [Tanticharoenia sakaeratensis NBRC 103193]GBQ23106.1 iron-sulfur oxidoreductase [Tanticharoenia sakaeratensis NBRC 103193]
MKVGLFVPCYVDMFHPQTGIATLELLERLGLSVEYPLEQTCCGQPMTNTGCSREAADTEALFVRNFAKYDVIVTPSGSCTNQVRNNLTAIEQTEAVRHVRTHTYELVEFLHDVLKVESFPWAAFPHKVALHNNCNTLRNLRIASMSERRETPFSKPRALLEKVRGIEFVELARPDECCGFGGTFSVFEEGVSSKMGADKVRDQLRSGADYVTSSDSSCMMHQEGCARRMNANMKYIHIAEILNGAAA